MRESNSFFEVGISKQLRVLPLNKSYGAYCLKFSASPRIPKDFKAVIKPEVHEGVALLTELEAYENGKISKIPFHPIYIAGPDLADAVLRVGAHEAFECNEKTGDSKYLRPVSLEALAEDPSLKDKLVIADMRSHSITTLAGVRLPVGVRINYETWMSDEYFDLEEVLKALKKSSQVIPMGTRSNNAPDTVGISDIPYYNASEGREFQISFIFMPTPAEMKKMVAYNDLHDCGWSRWQEAVLALDFLKIKKYLKGTAPSWARPKATQTKKKPK